MNRLITVLDNDVSASLLTALLHSLWQAVVIAGLLMLFLGSKAAKNSNIRYLAALIALTTILLCGLFTWSVLEYEPPAATEVPSIASSTQETVSTTVPAGSSQKNALVGAKTFEPEAASDDSVRSKWRTWVIGAWLIGVALMLLRAIYIVVGGAKLRRLCRPLEDELILALVEQLRKCVGIARRIRVAVSEHIFVPGVVGCIWPTLLLPAWMISGVSTDDLRAILAHELAHIRRYDYLVNFYQMVIEAILFFNPAVWWISKQVRFEREACCDQVGVAATGQRIRYAEVLTNWAHRLKDENANIAAPAMGFGKADDKGALVERMRRIVVVGHRPRLRVSWYVAAITLILSVTILIGLWRGTTMTVALAGKLLTPQQRIDKIAEISKEYGFEDREYGPDDKILVSGIVRTYDGRPLPKDTHIMLRSHRPRHGTSKEIGVSRNGHFAEKGVLKCYIEYGRIFVMASSNRYAPAFAGPFEVEPGGRIEGIEMVLEQGFESHIKVMDEGNRPIPGAQIVGGYVYPNGGYHHTIKLATDQNGLAIIQHALARKLGLQIEADGFESERIDNLVPEPDRAVVLKLKATPPSTGIVTSKTSGKPIEGAEVRVMMSYQGNHSYSENNIDGRPDAVTDKDGRFRLSKLRSDRQYLLLVRAKDCGRQYLSNIKPGDNDIKIELGPKKIIRGRIMGDVEQLSKDKNGQPGVAYWQYYRFGDHSQSHAQKWAPVTIKEDVGYFQIDECWGQRVNIWAAGQRTSVDVDEDTLDDVMIELKPEEAVMREVVLRFHVPQRSPEVKGGVRIDYAKPEDSGMKPEWLDIQNGQARYEIPVPGKFKYSIDYTQGKRPVGYWFEEIKPMDIPAGNGPFVIDVPVYPAGAIYGRILHPDGSLAKDARASLIVARKPEMIRNRFSIHDALQGSGLLEGKFNASPLPLGGEYVIVAYSQNSFMATEAILLDQANPIIDRDVQLVKGTKLSGQLLDIDGTPARYDIELKVSIIVGEHSWGTTAQKIRPDVNGCFSFENINPDISGKYSIHVNVGPGYRPARHDVVDMKQSVIIRLEKGLCATGIVIDEATGWPVPGVKVRAYFVEQTNGKVESEYLEADSSTNHGGEFVFSNMAKRSYELMFSGVRIADPRMSYRLIGGQKEPLIVRARIREKSNLKARKPLD
jgi:beta-lactamase regulating signal transducer with metallopeptidase domain